MLIISKKPRAMLRAESWSVTLDQALRAAAQRLRWSRLLRAAASTLPLPIAATFLYILIARFTLLDIPRWPAALALPLWFVVLAAWAGRQRVSTAEAARYLDNRLKLDQRVSTCVEVLNSARLVRARQPNAMHHALVVEAAEQLEERLPMLPGPFALRLNMGSALAIGAALLALTAALVLPTNTEALRGERSALSRSVQEQLTQVQALRADVEGNKALSPALKQSVLAELDSLQNKLQDTPLDQAAGIAALADSEEKLRGMLQTPSSDFDALIVAARFVWNAASTDVQWDPLQATTTSDLGRASEASLFMAGNVGQLSGVPERLLAVAIDRASAQAAARDAGLGRALALSADSIRARDRNKASQALTDVAQRFAAADRQHEDSLSLENVLSNLNKGREQLAQVGKPTGTRAQVGFRRHGADAASSAAQPQATPDGNLNPNGADAQNGSADTNQPPQNNGLGQNVPAYGSSNPSGGAPPASDANGAKPGSNSGQSGPSAPGGSSSGGSKAGSGADGGQSSTNGAGAPTGAGGQGGSGPTGTFQGPVSGPVGGANGAISQVKNPTGNGAGGAGSGQQNDTGTDGSNTERVYVPTGGKEEAGGGVEAGGVPGQAAPQDPSQDGVGGKIGDGSSTGETTQQGRGAGGLAPVHTPYKQVIGQYAQQATDALQRAYIPPDAKQYVRDYFSGLGK